MSQYLKVKSQELREMYFASGFKSQQLRIKSQESWVKSQDSKVKILELLTKIL